MKINSYTIEFLDSDTCKVIETHRTVYTIKPTHENPETLLRYMIDKQISKSDVKDNRDKLLIVRTSKGKFNFSI